MIQSNMLTFRPHAIRIKPMHSEFKTVGLIGKLDNPAVPDTLTKLYEFLTSRGFHALVDSNSKPYVKAPNPDSCLLHEMGNTCDLVITIGGDGTLLAAARLLASHDVPLVGVNLGRLGFLVDIKPEQVLTKVEEIVSGKFTEEERFLLRAKIVRDGDVIREQTAVNEVVVHRWITTSMIEIDTSINGVFLNSQRSDGLIVSTPTGSTAYALAGGGPILHPSLNAVVLVPINPHTLTNRPIVIDGESEVEIAFSQKRQIHAQVTCDNISMPDVLISDRIRINKEPKPVKILHPCDYDYFEILRAKLHWSS